jgi:outer membrane protein TolC
MGLPVDTRISIPETEFEITPNALSLAPDTTTRTEYLLLKRTSSYWNTKKSEANYYPSLSLTGGYNFIGQGPEMPWFKKPSDGVYWSDFASVRAQFTYSIFFRIWNKARVSQADNKLLL